MSGPPGDNLLMHIDKASPADIPALSELLSALFAQEEEFAPNPAAQAQGLAQIIHNPEVGVVLVARHGGQVLGMVGLLFTVSTALGGRVALLEDLVVSAEARNAGLGAELLAQAIAVARVQGCKRITLLTDRANEAAQRLYRKQGFVVSNMVPMRLALT